MSWIDERWSRKSAINGRIDVWRSFGQWHIFVDGCCESTVDLERIWRKVINRLPKSLPISRVLLIGLAGGSHVNIIGKRWPAAKITAVEIDPEMVELFHRIHKNKISQALEILTGDAAQIVPTLTGTYDLIIVDAFIGHDIPHAIAQRAFFDAVCARLDRNGFVLLNAYRQPSVLEVADRSLVRIATWKHSLNTFAFYQRAEVARGVIPAGYVPFRTCREFLERDCIGSPRYRLLSGEGYFGTQWHTPIFDEETVMSDAQPAIIHDGRIHHVTWNRVERKDIPHGWRAMSGLKRTAFLVIDGAIGSQRTWSSHAKRHLAEWRRQEEWEIVTPTPDEFIAAYRRCHLSWIWKRYFVGLLRDKIVGHHDRVRLIGVRRRGTQQIVAGFASLDVPEIGQSIHLISFIHDVVRRSPIGVGMIDVWVSRARERGVRYCDFDAMWTMGNPESWVGFSRFKAQFNPVYVNYPESLERWSRG